MTTILATVVVLWVYYPTSKGYQWAPAGTAVSMDDCENDVAPREIAKDDAGGKGPVIDWRCVRYRRY
jgi:hypothetical protein